VTEIKFEAMDGREQRELAWRLAEGSEVFDFETALRIVQAQPVEAERLLRDREKRKRLLEELDRARERRRLALREEFR
jgi:hypothetical protein